MPGMTFAQKVLSRSSGHAVRIGDIVNAKIDLAMSHENTALVLKSFREIGAQRIWSKEDVVVLFDHRVPAPTVKAAEAHKEVRSFAVEEGIPHFYDAGEGVCHQVLPEKGHVLPGMVIVGTDSHTVTYGALGAFATGIGATEMAAVWATGELWMKVPETKRMHIKGTMPQHTSSKDVILHIIGDQGADGADYQCIEFVGETVSGFSVPGRMVLCNMSVEMGAKAGVCFPDEVTEDWLSKRAKRPWEPVRSDDDAAAEDIDYEVKGLSPQVAKPHQVENVVSVDEVEGIKIDQALLGSCTNGRLEDLAAAEGLLNGEKIARGVRFLVVPASQEIYIDAAKSGLLASLATSGAIIVNPGCGPCLGAHEGLLAKGEKCISTTNRNFKGRMGSPEAEIYLASPETVAASALHGEITDPRRA